MGKTVFDIETPGEEKKHPHVHGEDVMFELAIFSWTVREVISSNKRR